MTSHQTTKLTLDEFIKRRHDESLAIVDHLERMAKIQGWIKP